MKDYLIKYSTYFLILGLGIIALRLLGIEHRRLDSIPVAGQYAVGVIFFLIGVKGMRLKKLS